MPMGAPIAANANASVALSVEAQDPGWCWASDPAPKCCWASATSSGFPVPVGDLDRREHHSASNPLDRDVSPFSERMDRRRAQTDERSKFLD